MISQSGVELAKLMRVSTNSSLPAVKTQVLVGSCGLGSDSHLILTLVENTGSHIADSFVEFGIGFRFCVFKC